MKTTHTFDKPEVMVPFKCDVHGWMNAYVGVLPHPYFAVTKDDGKFELANLPAGTYTIEAWHEKLGPMTQSVTIGYSNELILAGQEGRNSRQKGRKAERQKGGRAGWPKAEASGPAAL